MLLRVLKIEFELTFNLIVISCQFHQIPNIEE